MFARARRPGEARALWKRSPSWEYQPTTCRLNIKRRVGDRDDSVTRYSLPDACVSYLTCNTSPWWWRNRSYEWLLSIFPSWNTPPTIPGTVRLLTLARNYFQFWFITDREFLSEFIKRTLKIKDKPLMQLLKLFSIYLCSRYVLQLITSVL